ncbi:nuclear transport factor 2 family protein [Saccharopolyspora sp. TS4A08]|uniref:Nuclear transport factor 2 family protein n=1 Tax=Saccharopolyspora ipomoeae TaxID=3042027 RepID=A0ABT6PJT7_9PSEU|nr:nuclear transport factor 2 family protein [Saccharopolyspora sp. TS4A08]MDI2028224.1 nuclear transport factor 2 family protein [Saccharopolyspora sp. TS4A08]
MPTVDELLARAEIGDVLARYAHAIDRGDRELARTCYHPDATDDHGRFSGTVDELFEFFETYGATLESTFHFMSPPTIALDGERAEVETYCLYRRQPVEGGAVFQGLRYFDIFERRAGRWLIAERTVILDWEHDAPPLPAAASPPTWVRGSRGDTDPAAPLTRSLAASLRRPAG